MRALSDAIMLSTLMENDGHRFRLAAEALIYYVGDVVEGRVLIPVWEY